ncbi:hypothetical protein C8Q76DRAFT_587996, partial [Earliella scabrosa]
MRFPHLIRHRQLFIREGASALLERLLKSWFSAPWRDLSDDERQRVTSVVRTLGMLASEAEVDGAEFAQPSVPDGTLLDNTPFLPVQRGQNHVDAFLTHDSLELIGHLLPMLNTLSLPLAAFVLRLSVQMTQGDHAVTWARLGGNRLIESFLQRVMDFEKEDGQRSEVIPAVNTIIYLALCDASRPQRNGFALASTGDIRYWLTVLLNVIHRAPMNGVMLRQISWAICALSWALTPQTNGVTIRPLIPRLHRTHNLSQALTDLLSCDQDPQVLNTVVLALEGMLWNISPTKWEDHWDLCKALQSRFGPFLIELHKRSKNGGIPTHRVVQLLVPLSRIAAYLSFYDYDGPNYAKVQLIPTVFSLFSQLGSSKVSMAGAIGGSQSGGNPPEEGHMELATRRWTQKAACRMVLLYLDDPRWKLNY